MSLPNPPIDLTGHCSVIYNNTLFIFSPAGFQSLPLTQDATWSVLSPGVSVVGGVCVKAIPPSDPTQAALYIVGGAANSSNPSYPGLQKYTFTNSSWETISPVVSVTQGRQNHGAAYLNSTDSIFVYAGTQAGEQPDYSLSSQTFLISASPPYSVLSFTSEAPPLVAPMVMPWDENRAVIVGGASSNTQIWTFGLAQGFANVGTVLPEGIEYQNTTQCMLAIGDDGSKVLEIFDMGTSPNNVTDYVLLTASGAPGATGQTVGGQPSKKRKRDLTLADWPTYNGTLAPTTTRSGYQIADSPDGIYVITGGNSQNPVEMFNSKENSWMNATEILGGGQQTPLQTTSTLPSVSVVAPIASSAATSSATAVVAAAGGNSKSKTLTVLGGALGAVFGLAAILVIVLLLLKWKQDKKKRNTQNYVNEKNDDRLSFADQGAEFMHEAGGSVGRRYSQSIHSRNSMQIFHNRGKSGKSGHRRALPSDEVPIVKNRSPLGMSEPMEMSPMSGSPRTSPPTSRRLNTTPEAPVQTVSPLANSIVPPDPPIDPERSRSTGWSTYFANNDVTNLASMRSPNRDTVDTIDPSFRSSGFSRSDLTDSGSRLAAAGVKPLELNLGPKFDGQRLSMSKVTSGSPTFRWSTEDQTRGQSAEVSRWNKEPALTAVNTIPRSGHEQSATRAYPSTRWDNDSSMKDNTTSTTRWNNSPPKTTTATGTGWNNEPPRNKPALPPWSNEPSTRSINQPQSGKTSPDDWNGSSTRAVNQLKSGKTSPSGWNESSTMGVSQPKSGKTSPSGWNESTVRPVDQPRAGKTSPPGWNNASSTMGSTVPRANNQPSTFVASAATPWNNDLSMKSTELARSGKTSPPGWNQNSTAPPANLAPTWKNEDSSIGSVPSSRWANEPSTATNTPAVSSFAVSTPDMVRSDAASDTISISSSRYSSMTNPYFSGGVNPYHMNDPTTELFKSGRKSGQNSPVRHRSPTSSPQLRPTKSPSLRPKSNLSIVTDASGDPRASAITVFPGLDEAPALPSPRLAVPPAKGASSLAPPSPTTRPPLDFPMPRAYAADKPRDSAASTVTLFPRGVPSPTVASFGPGPAVTKPKLVDARAAFGAPRPPPPAAHRTPGASVDEDMSWLNIDAGQ